MRGYIRKGSNSGLASSLGGIMNKNGGKVFEDVILSNPIHLAMTFSIQTEKYKWERKYGGHGNIHVHPSRECPEV